MSRSECLECVQNVGKMQIVQVGLDVCVCVVSNMSIFIAETASTNLVSQLGVSRNGHVSCQTKQDDATKIKSFSVFEVIFSRYICKFCSAF